MESKREKKGQGQSQQDGSAERGGAIYKKGHGMNKAGMDLGDKEGRITGLTTTGPAQTGASASDVA